MKPLVTLLILLYCYSAFGQAQQAGNKAEKQVLAKVLAVKEVKGFYRYARKHKPSIIYNGGPHPGLNYYWAQVGYGDDSMMRTIFHFYVDPKTFQVFYVDLATTEGSEGILTLKQWRHLRTTPEWSKPHYYKAGKLIVAN
nr:hypothetical protein [Mucilaginibacter sp. L294]